MKDAMRNPGVVAVLIVCSTVLGLALLGVMGWLLYQQRDVSTLLTLVNTFVSVFLLKRMSDVDGRVGKVESQTNGHTTRLMDAALKDKE